MLQLTKTKRDKLIGTLSNIRGAVDQNAKPEARELINTMVRELKSLDEVSEDQDSGEKLGNEESGQSVSTSQEIPASTQPSPSETPEPEKQEPTSGEEETEEEIPEDSRQEGNNNVSFN